MGKHDLDNRQEQCFQSGVRICSRLFGVLCEINSVNNLLVSLQLCRRRGVLNVFALLCTSFYGRVHT